MDYIRRNANEIITSKLHEKTTASIYKDLITAINTRNDSKFVINMQIYVTRLGIITSSVIIGEHIESGVRKADSGRIVKDQRSYPHAVNYMCNKILKQEYLGKILLALPVHGEANKEKHTDKNIIDIDIEEYLRYYNRLIDALVEYGLEAFSISKLRYNAVNYRDQKIFEDKYDVKYFTLDNVKLKVELLKNISLDEYKKTVNTQLNIFWPEVIKNRAINVKININDRIVDQQRNIDLSTNDYPTFTIEAKEEELDRKKLSITISLTLIKYIFKTYTTGFWLWKKEKSWKEPIVLDSKTIELSIIV